MSIRSLPHFLMKPIDAVHPSGLQSKITELAGPADPSYTAPGASTGASAATSEASSSGSAGTSLMSQVDKQQSTCLNEKTSHPLSSIFQRGSSSWLESDADEQLLISLVAQNTLKLRALRFTTDNAHSGKAPKTVKVFINRPTISMPRVQNG